MAYGIEYYLNKSDNTSGRINEIVRNTSALVNGGNTRKLSDVFSDFDNSSDNPAFLRNANGFNFFSRKSEFKNAFAGQGDGQSQLSQMLNGEGNGNTSEDTGGTVDSEIKLVEPYNPTDPIVVFDPTFEKSELVREFIGDQPFEAADAQGDTPDANNLDIDGVKIPIIQLNNTAVNFENIDNFTLKLTGFLPEIEIKIYDYDGIIKATDVPGMSNLITVVLLSPVEGTNKKISLDFYVTECKFNKDSSAVYKGVMNLNTFRAKQNIQIGSGKLTTYEMLEEIAKQNKLGFAATEDCKAINDKRFRQLYREDFKEFIEDQLSFAGTGSDTVIDAWIDEFGYLVMVNFSWVMNYNVDPFQLTIKSTNGVNTGSKQPEEFKSTVKDTVRMINNMSATDNMDNLKFNVYTNKVDNTAAMEAGTSSKYYYLVDPGGDNLIKQADGAVVEPSMDGANDVGNYYAENVEFIGIEFTDDDDEENTPKLVQRKNIENYKASMCNKAIVVEMPKANYLLQRGTLVSVSVDEHNQVTKSKVLDASDVVTKTEPDATVIEESTETEESNDAKNALLLNKMESAQNISVSGIYYIQDITFKYTRGEPEIKQIMTLIKKGVKTNLYNYTTARKQKFNTPQKQQGGTGLNETI